MSRCRCVRVPCAVVTSSATGEGVKTELLLLRGVLLLFLYSLLLSFAHVFSSPLALVTIRRCGWRTGWGITSATAWRALRWRTFALTLSTEVQRCCKQQHAKKQHSLHS